MTGLDLAHLVAWASRPTGTRTATPPGFLGPSAVATDATAFLHGKDAATLQRQGCPSGSPAGGAACLVQGA
eukprot:14123693-Alexandrium_andersonii.AAC.1